MYLDVEKEELSIIFEKLTKTNTLRELAKKTKIPKSSLSAYKNKKRLIPKKYLNILIEHAKHNLNKKKIIQTFPDNWKQIKGGKVGVEKKKERGTFEQQLILARKENSKKLVIWHKEMKQKSPEKYYNIQHSRFRKIAGFKFTTKNNERVRNILEKQVADLLTEIKIKYKYEPLVKSKGKYFFPDFLINDKIIIECTMWNGTDKAIKLKEKIKYLTPKYKVYVVIPKALNKHYQIINNHLILGVDELVPVAQTFRDLK